MRSSPRCGTTIPSTGTRAARGTGFWCLTKHDDVQWASRDPDNFISASGFTLMDIEQGDLQSSAMSQMLPGMDRPEHTRFRRIVSKGFSPRTIRLVEEHLALKAKLIVDSVLDRRVVRLRRRRRGGAAIAGDR